MKRWTGGMFDRFNVLRSIINGYDGLYLSGARARVGKKKHQQTQLEFFNRRGLKSSSNHQRMAKSNLNASLLSNSGDMRQSETGRRSSVEQQATTNQVSSLDINSLLRTQLLKRRREVRLDGSANSSDSSNTMEDSDHYHQEGGNDESENDTSEDEAFENASKFAIRYNIKNNSPVRFIDEGIDKTEEINPHLIRVLDSPETTIDSPSAIFRDCSPIKSSIQHHDKPVTQLEPPLKKSKPTTPSSQSHIAMIGCEEDRDDLLTRTKTDDDIVLENEIKEHTTKQSNELEQLRLENQKLRTLLKQFLSQDKKQ